MIALLILLIAAALGLFALAILYPDDPEGRAQRFQRVLAACSAFCGPIAAAHLGAALLNSGFWPDPPAVTGIWDAVLLLALCLVPFSIAERVAALARPRRTLAWGAGAILFGLGWAALISFVLVPGGVGAMAWPALLFGFAAPGVAAGLAWTAMLPPRDGPVGRVFE